MLILDFETRSEADLLKVGAYNYASHPRTEVICLSYAWADGKTVYTWAPGDTLPQAFRYDIRDGVLVAAHNAEFDREIWNEVFAPLMALPQLPVEQMYCVAAMCRVNGMPSSLDKATRCAQVEHLKNKNGTRLIKAMCIPPYDESPALMTQMIQYCEEDVKATRALIQKLRPMTQAEHADWVVNTKINERGVFIDRYMAGLACHYAGEESAQIARRLNAITDDAVEKHTQIQRVKTWLIPRLTPEQWGLMTVYKKGEPKESLDGNVREQLLACADLDDDAREVIELVDAANKSSVSKFQKMLDLSDEEGCIRGAFIYFGASQTGRFSAKGLQLHNFVRDCYDWYTVDVMIEQMEQGHPITDVMGSLSKALRGAVVPVDDDSTFVVGDWSAIEACALPWLADDDRAKPKLDALHRKEDIYKSEFTGWDGDDRQVHKVIELALGYGGAIGAFKSMARNYGVTLPDNEIHKIVKVWRQKNQWAVAFWRAVELAAKRAVNNPGAWYDAGRLKYIATTMGVGEKTLLCALPDGTLLAYPDVKFEEDDRGGTKLTALKANWTPAQGQKEWPRVDLWYGLLVENATQGICASLLREKLRVIEDNCDSCVVVAHVHDEIVVECDDNLTQHVVARLKNVMETCPKWAEGLPLRAEPKIMYRYGK